jgi:GNAT superfamily N-acetyltransferase
VTSSIRPVTHPTDPAILGYASLLRQTFADKNLCLPAYRMEEFLADPGPERTAHLLVLEEGGQVVGGTFFSCSAHTGAGFSEYLILAPTHRGGGYSRRLIEARQAVLDEAARGFGFERCPGLFIECESPARTPSEVAERERLTAMDLVERRRYFHHIGYRQVDVAYRQLPLCPQRVALDYLDLFFFAWNPALTDALPADFLLGSIRPVYQGWSPETWEGEIAGLRRQVGTGPVRLLPLFPMA